MTHHMLEAVAPILSAVKNSGPTIYVGAFLATALMLFLPEVVAMQIGIAEVRGAYRLHLGLVFVASTSLLVAYGLFALKPVFKSVHHSWQVDRNARLTLQACTAAEKEILRQYIGDGENTVFQSIYDGVANGLEAKGIVYRASNVSVPGQPGFMFPYNLQPYARKILDKERWLLD